MNREWTARTRGSTEENRAQASGASDGQQETDAQGDDRGSQTDSYEYAALRDARESVEE